MNSRRLLSSSRARLWGGAPMLLTLASFLVVHCGGDEEPAPACTPGATIACLGPGACDGAQMCLADGSAYNQCDCGTTSSSGTGGSAGAGGVTGTGGNTSSTGGAGGAGGDATGGAGGSGGGMTANCQPTGGENACTLCAKNSCCNVYLTCFASVDCSCYVTCSFKTPGLCLGTCGLSAVPAGAIELLDCTHKLCSIDCTP